jgi:uncharacterized protein YndB with AHSA1/START domain
MAPTSDAPAGELLVEVARDFAAPPERVFDAWLDPAAAGRWLFRTPAGVLRRAEIDARVGGAFMIAEDRGGEPAEHFGRFLAIDRPRLLEFTFATEPGEPPSRVRVTIAPRPGGGCRLTLTHVMDARWAEWADRTRDGWTAMLASLAADLHARS